MSSLALFIFSLTAATLSVSSCFVSRRLRSRFSYIRFLASVIFSSGNGCPQVGQNMSSSLRAGRAILMFTSSFHLFLSASISFSRFLTSACESDTVVCLVVIIPCVLYIESWSFFLWFSRSLQKLWYSDLISLNLLSADVSISLLRFWAKASLRSISLFAEDALPALRFANSSDSFITFDWISLVVSSQFEVKSFSSSWGSALLSSDNRTGISSIFFLISLILKPLCLR